MAGISHIIRLNPFELPYNKLHLGKLRTTGFEAVTYKPFPAGMREAVVLSLFEPLFAGNPPED